MIKRDQKVLHFFSPLNHTRGFMKKFIFRLETLLKIRFVRESTLKRDLEHAYQKWHHNNEKEKMLKAQIEALVDEMQRKRESGIFDLQETYHQILNHLQQSLLQIQQNLLSQKGQIEEHQKRLQQAIQERKVIEKIKENHYAGWESDLNQIEDELLDEISCRQPVADSK